MQAKVCFFLIISEHHQIKTAKSPTIGSNVEEIVCKNVHFFMWDIGGQESLRSSWNTYFADSDFVIFVVDSTDRERLPISKMEARFYIKQRPYKLLVRTFWTQVRTFFYPGTKL